MNPETITPEQALQLMAQVIEQVKFTLREGDVIRQAYQVLDGLVKKNAEQSDPPEK